MAADIASAVDGELHYRFSLLRMGEVKKTLAIFMQKAYHFRIVVIALGEKVQICETILHFQIGVGDSVQVQDGGVGKY